MASIARTADPAGVNSSSNVATYTGVSIGDAAPNRIVVVNVTTELASASINSVTCGGVAMNAGTQGNQGIVYARTFYLLVPTGTTANIVVTYGANASSTQNHISVYRILDATYTSTGADQSTDMDATDPLTTGSTTIGTGGVMIAVAGCATDTVAKTWSNLTEDLDADKGSHRHTTATSTTAGTATRTCTGATNGEDGALSWLIFADNAEPTVALNSPADASSDTDTTPTLDFTGTDAESDDVRYNVQIYQPLVSDDFNRANENPIAGNWTNDALGEGSDNQLKIVSNQLQAVTADTSCEAYWNADTFSGAIEEYFTVVTKPGNTQRVELGFIQQPGSATFDGYKLSCRDNAGTDDFLLERMDDSIGTTLATATVEFNDGDIIALSRSSTGVFTVWLNGVAIAVSSADTTYTGSFHALVTIRGTTGVIDNWGVRQIISDKVSGTDSGFANPDNGGDTDPFTSGENIQFTVQAGDALAVGTYYWRVRGIDPTGSNSYGAWSSARSFTITAGGGTSVKDLIGGFIPFAR